MRQQLSDEPLQGGEAAAAAAAGPYGQRARVTPERLAFVIKEQWKTFNQVCFFMLVWHRRGSKKRGRGDMANPRNGGETSVTNGNGATASLNAFLFQKN